jgi:hypothetical protein
MTMGIDDADTMQRILGQGHEYLVNIAARVDDGRFLRPFTAKNVTVRLDGSHH